MNSPHATLPPEGAQCRPSGGRAAGMMNWMRLLLVEAAALGSALLVLFVLLLVAFLLTGCAEFDAARTGVARHGATAADSALGLAKWEVCTATSVGALERELGADQERILGWMLWCAKKPGPHPLLTPVLPDAPTVLPQGFTPLGGPGLKEVWAPGSQTPSRPPWGPSRSWDGPANDLRIGL